MAKIVQFKKSSQEEENWFSTIIRESDDLCADVRDVKTVVNVAIETLGEEGASSAAVGALLMIEHKLKLIESAAQIIFESARVPKLPKIQKGARS